jgi:hypothetical protein
MNVSKERTAAIFRIEELCFLLFSYLSYSWLWRLGQYIPPGNYRIKRRYILEEIPKSWNRLCLRCLAETSLRASCFELAVFGRKVPCVRCGEFGSSHTLKIESGYLRMRYCPMMRRAQRCFSFLGSRGGGGWPVSHPRPLHPWGAGSHCIVSWMGCRTSVQTGSARNRTPVPRSLSR